MVEEFDLLEEVEVQFCDEECTESVWHGVNYSESLFCREKPKSELTVVIREEGCKKRSRLLQQKRRCCYSSDVAKLMFSS